MVPTNGADVINGNPGDDSLLGLGGNDTLYGNGGNDFLDGGSGNDRMEGGLGNDTFVVDAAGDGVVEGSNAGDDLVQASISYTLGTNLERLTLTGSGNLNGTGNGAANTLIGNAGNNLLDGGAGNDLLQGGDGNDTLLGGIGNDTLNGDAGNDLLDGGASSDSMTGGSGDDIYVFDNLGDTLIELAGGGNDTVRTSLNYTLGANLENIELSGSANLNGTGNALANSLTGNTGINRLDGGAGDDLLAGLRGSDTYLYGTNYGNDVIDNSGGVSADIDTVQLVGLNSNHVRFVQSGNDLQMVVLATSQTLTLKNFYLGLDYEIDRVRFDNNVTWNAAALKAAATSPVNVAPTSTNDTRTTLEDTPVILGSADFGIYSDPENTPLAAVKITSLPVLGSLQYHNGSSWIAVVQDQVISKADLDAGKLQFVPALNGNGSDYASIGFKVSDGTAFAVNANTLSVNVTAVNDGPTVSGPVNLPNGTEDSTYSITAAQLLANASDPDGDTLSVTNLSANHGTLADNGNGSWTFTPDANYNGAVTFNYQVIDGNGGSAAATQGFSLLGVNDAPTLQVALIDQLNGLGQAVAYTLPANTFADIDAGDSLVLTARLANGDPLPAWLSFDGPSRSFSGTPAAGTQPGGIAITVTATDSGGLSASDDFTLNLLSTLVGTPNDDLLTGSVFDDAIYGLAGNDTLIGGNGNDTLDGGSGNDALSAGEGSDMLLGGDGNDILRDIDGSGQVANNSLDAGAGDDTINVNQSNVNSVTTVIGGSGRDTYQLQPNSIGQLLVSDFAPGVTGDILDITTLLTNSSGYSAGNPFDPALGYLRLVQQGADTLLQWDRDGVGVATNSWQTVITLQNTNAATLTLDNFSPATSPAGGVINLIEGGAGDDPLTGTASADRLLGHGGNDTLLGLAGDDELDGGAGNDRLDGGAGSDSARYSAGISQYTFTFDPHGYLAVEAGAGSGEAGRDQIKAVEQLRFANGTITVNGSLGSEVLVNTTTASDQYSPSVAALVDGGYVVSWTSINQDGSGYGIYAQRYDASSVAVGGEVRVNTTIANDQVDPSVAALADGGYIVSWMSSGQDGSGAGVFAQRYDSSGSVMGGEVRVNSSTLDSQQQPAVSALSAGGYVVSWMSYSQETNSWDIYVQRYDATGAVVGGEERVNTSTANSQGDPAVVVLADGGYVVTWVSEGQDGSGDGIYSQRYDASGAAVGGEVRVNSSTVESQLRPSIGALSDGDYVVSWMSRGQDGSGWGIYAQRYDTGGAAVGGEVRVNSTTASDQQSPSVAGLADGGYLVSWMSSEQDGSTTGIYLQRYDASGTAQGGEVRVNTVTDNEQQSPSVAALADGGYVVSWISFGQENNSWDIYAQRYDVSGQTVTNTLTLEGDAGDNLVQLGSGDERIAGGGGNDTLFGGEGHDIALYHGSQHDFAIIVQAFDQISVNDLNAADGNEGIDILHDFESLQFSDGVQLQALRREVLVVNSSTFDSKQQPAISALSDGGYVVSWMSSGQDGSGFGIYLQRYNTSGATVGNEVRINSTIASDQQSPSVAALADGGYVVSWMSSGQDGSGFGIYAQRYDTSGETVGMEVRVNTVTTNDQDNPIVAALSDGGYVVSWMSSDQDGSGFGIYAQRYDSNSSAVGVEVRVNSVTASDQLTPSVAALSDGGYVVSWMSSGDGDGYGIYLQRYDSSGSALGVELRVNTVTAHHQVEPSVAAFADGGYVVSWMSFRQDGSSFGIYAQRYDTNGIAVGGEVQVNSTTLDSQQQPSICTLSDGGYVVSWESAGQDGNGIYAQRYDTGGSAVGGEVCVYISTLDGQMQPAISALIDGGYVVSWMSRGNNSASGIHTQRYDANGNPVVDHLEWTGDASANLIRSTVETDWFSGGTGADTFQFAQLPGNRADMITDFTQGSDVLALNSGLFNLQGQTVAETLANVSGTLNEVAGAHLVFNQNDHTLYYDADGAANGNAVAVVTLTGVSTLTASDVQLYV
ncbi:hypothetical protein PS723_04515 [Pseudomonas fluorescens]|uniref:Dystroglycan-type cadherin-like domain-containing protein n=1 Tax=Pseudomonas fluorescens TaxID=294 RepID=A0A5E7EE24_PSEFL|nr:hypothetical protein PS723_04515 [Pseudomonas fluorescens]